MPDGKTNQSFDISPIVEKYFHASKVKNAKASEERVASNQPAQVHTHYLDLFQAVWNSGELDPVYFQLAQRDFRDGGISGAIQAAAGDITEILARRTLPGLIHDYDPNQTYLDKLETDLLITKVGLARLKKYPTQKNLARVAQIGFRHDGSRINKNTVLGDIEITGFENPPLAYLAKKVRNLSRARTEHPEVFRGFTKVDLVVAKDAQVPELDGINEPFRLPQTFKQGAMLVAEFYFSYHPASSPPLTDIQPLLEEYISDYFVPLPERRHFTPRFASI